jgi:hypothetical protein
MTKKFVLVFLMVLGFSFAASASLSADTPSDSEEVQSGILAGGDSIGGVDGGGVEFAYNKHRKHRRNRRGNVRRGRGHRRGGVHRGRSHRRGRHHRRGHQKGYVCYSESYYTGQQFWGSDYNIHHAKWLANDACYKFNSDCYIIGCY